MEFQTIVEMIFSDQWSQEHLVNCYTCYMCLLPLGTWGIVYYLHFQAHNFSFLFSPLKQLQWLEAKCSLVPTWIHVKCDPQVIAIYGIIAMVTELFLQDISRVHTITIKIVNITLVHSEEHMQVVYIRQSLY